MMFPNPIFLYWMNPHPMYKFDGLYFRALELSDLEPIRGMRNDPSTWCNLTDITFLTSEAQLGWFRSLHKSTHRHRYYAVCNRKESLVGLVRMDEIDLINRSARVGCDVFPKYRGKGIGSNIMRGVVRYCFDQLNLHRVWLAVLETNVPAIRVYRKAGFKPEGRYTEAIYRNGRYLDYWLFSIIKSNG